MSADLAGILEALEPSTLAPWWLHEGQCIWLIEEGAVDIFATTIDETGAAGARRSLYRVFPKMAIMPVARDVTPAAVALLAVPLPDTRILSIPLSDLQRLGIKTAIVSSDSEASVRQVLGPTTAQITRFDCGAAVFGKHWKFRRVARKLGATPAETICIGDEIRDIEAAKAAGMDSGAVAWGYALPSALQAAGPTHLFNSIEEMMQRLIKTK